MGMEQIIGLGIQHHAVSCNEALAAFLRDESGQDLIEYGLVGTLLGLCAIASLNTVCARVVTLLTTVNTGLTNAI